MSMSIDRMYEYDLGIDYDDHKDYFNRIHNATLNVVYVDSKQLMDCYNNKNFWADLIEQDIIEHPEPPKMPEPPKTRWGY